MFNITNITNIAMISGMVGAAFAPIAGARIQTRAWVRGFGYAGADLFQGAVERAIELLRTLEEEERVEAALATLAARA